MIKKLYRALIYFCIVWSCSLIGSSIYAEAIVVDSTGDDPALNSALSALTAGGFITLRSAIERVDANPDTLNSIHFTIPGPGPYVINVGTGAGVFGQALPVISKQVAIDGYTQAGSVVATATANATIRIILNGLGVNAGIFQDGLTLNTGSDYSVMRGLVIQNFPQNGINIQDGIGQSVAGNYIGTNQVGTAAASNLGNGIYIGLNATAVTIGSSAIADRNIISGQQFTTGATPISGAGVFIQGSANQVIGNYLGTDVSGTNALSNRTGVYVYSAVPTNLNNTVQNNIIAFNSGTGVGEGSGVTVDRASNNTLLSNSIFGNMNSGVLTNGITLINNGNDNSGTPTITSGTISGTTLNIGGAFSSLANPNSSFMIQFFLNPALGSITPSQIFIGQGLGTTGANGSATFNNIRLFSNAVVNQQVSATITLLSSMGIPLNTSPYSVNLVLAQGQTSGTIDTSITFDNFQGVRALAVVIDSAGRAIVGGLEGAIVRYNTSGAIDLRYDAFPGTAVRGMIIDNDDTIIAVGTEGSVVRYTATGAIDLVFSSFPGILANAVIFDAVGDVIVGGLQSTIVKYSNVGATQGRIIATYNTFPGNAVNGLALDSAGRIIACGLQGQVVRYTSAGTIETIYSVFPGIAANAVVIDANDNAIVIGKATVIVTPASNVVSGLMPAAATISSINMVRYNTAGTIDLTFAPFMGLNAEDVILDLNSNIIVCGLESLVVQYSSSSGTINFAFEAFPGINGTRLALTSANQVIAVGWEGSVVRYYN